MIKNYVNELLKDNKREINTLNKRLDSYMEDLKNTVNTKDAYYIVRFAQDKINRINNTYNQIEFLELENRKLQNILEG